MTLLYMKCFNSGRRVLNVRKLYIQINRINFWGLFFLCQLALLPLLHMQIHATVYHLMLPSYILWWEPCSLVLLWHSTFCTRCSPPVWTCLHSYFTSCSALFLQYLFTPAILIISPNPPLSVLIATVPSPACIYVSAPIPASTTSLNLLQNTSLSLPTNCTTCGPYTATTFKGTFRKRTTSLLWVSPLDSWSCLSLPPPPQHCWHAITLILPLLPSYLHHGIVWFHIQWPRPFVCSTCSPVHTLLSTFLLSIIIAAFILYRHSP